MTQAFGSASASSSSPSRESPSVHEIAVALAAASGLEREPARQKLQASNDPGLPNVSSNVPMG